MQWTTCTIHSPLHFSLARGSVKEVITGTPKLLTVAKILSFYYDCRVLSPNIPALSLSSSNIQNRNIGFSLEHPKGVGIVGIVGTVGIVGIVWIVWIEFCRPEPRLTTPSVLVDI